jgi:hypothetical protein
VHFSGIENFISQRCKMLATKWKWNEHKFNMKKFQNWDVGALVLWRAFGLTETSQTFCYENWQNLMNERASHFCGSWILAITVFNNPKSASSGGIAGFFRVWICDQIFWVKVRVIKSIEMTVYCIFRPITNCFMENGFQWGACMKNRFCYFIDYS